MTKWEVTKCCKKLIVYLMLMGNSHPYPELILEENGLKTDDDDVDDSLLYSV